MIGKVQKMLFLYFRDPHHVLFYLWPPATSLAPCRVMGVQRKAGDVNVHWPGHHHPDHEHSHQTGALLRCLGPLVYLQLDLFKAGEHNIDQ